MGYSAFPKSGAAANCLTRIAESALGALEPSAKVGQLVSWQTPDSLLYSSHPPMPALHNSHSPLVVGSRRSWVTSRYWNE